MHDWVLRSLLFDWKSQRLVVSLGSYSFPLVELIAEGVASIQIPRQNPWGPSVYVLKTRGPSDEGEGRRKLEIEMQSGDVITIVAASFQIPPEDPLMKFSPDRLPLGRG